jgi:hypothetical protein
MSDSSPEAGNALPCFTPIDLQKFKSTVASLHKDVKQWECYSQLLQNGFSSSIMTKWKILKRNGKEYY